MTQKNNTQDILKLIDLVSRYIILGGIHMNYTDDARIFALAGAILN